MKNRLIIIVLIMTLISPVTGSASGGKEIEGETIVNYLHYVPVYGVVMEVAIDLFFLFGGHQKSSVEKALDQIKYALTDLDKRIQALDAMNQTLALELVRTQNQQRLARYRDYSRQIQALALEVRSKPAGPKQRKVLVDKAAIYADALIDDSEFNHFWEWSAVTKDNQLISADFSPIPGFILYNAALGVWIAALEVYSEGDYELVLDYAPALKAHAQFMSSLPQQVTQRISCLLTGYQHTPAANGKSDCTVWPKCFDSFSRSYLEFPNLTTTAQVPKRCDEIYEAFDNQAWADSGKKSIETHYGVDSMVQWANLLEEYATKGRTGEAIGRFEASPYPYLPVFVYSIVEDGSLQWRRHRPLPVQPQTDLRAEEDPAVRVVQPRSDPMRAGTKIRISDPNLSAARTGAGQRVTPDPIKSLPQTRVDGPVQVNNDWGNYIEIFPAGGSSIYALTSNGDLVWYDHNGMNDGNTSFTGPKVVQKNFGNFRKIISAGDGVLYAITQNDQFHWYRHNGVATGGGIETWSGPISVGGGWASFKNVFSGGDGVLFAVRPDGTLLRYRHIGWKTGEKTWEEPRQIGNGWQNFQNIFSAGNGSIYAVNPDGSFLWYRFTTNPDYWYGPITVATDVTGIRSIFAMLPREAIVVR